MDLLDLLDLDEPEPEPAGAYYLAGIEPRRRGRVRTMVYAGLDLWCAMSGGAMELTRGIDVVVRRREDGDLVARMRVADAAAAAFAVDQLRRQLDDLTAEEFRDLWGLD
ncbi:hypothetical protein GCM10022215_35990 [Nocardioides fonticola]|uniref:Uncharacterized protein n=1 Tax=Nocardioides fonticola TaxID=450363 RepID=A0ABP7XUW4_9ACTN